jgi:hypothetical protein
MFINLSHWWNQSNDKISQHGLKLIIIHMIEICPHFYYHYGLFHPWTPSKLLSHDINGVHHACPMQIEKSLFSLWTFVVSFFKSCVLSSYFPFEFAKIEILELLGVCG